MERLLDPFDSVTMIMENSRLLVRCQRVEKADLRSLMGPPAILGGVFFLCILVGLPERGLWWF